MQIYSVNVSVILHIIVKIDLLFKSCKLYNSPQKELTAYTALIMDIQCFNKQVHKRDICIVHMDVFIMNSIVTGLTQMQ